MKPDDIFGAPGDRPLKLEWVVAGLSGMATFGAALCCFAAATALALLHDGGHGQHPAGGATILLSPITLPIELLLAALAAVVVSWWVFRRRNVAPTRG